MQKALSALQHTVIALIDQTMGAMQELKESGLLKADQGWLTQDDLGECHKKLKNERKKVERLEYVVAVVGTMKAGKSTTINAIVGQEIMPHRSGAMTTLPTAISHKPGQIVPVLYLPQHSLLNKLMEETVKKWKSLEEVKKDEQRQKRPDIEIWNTLDAGKPEALQERYVSGKRIMEILMLINDLIRVANKLGVDVPYEDFHDIDQLPRIQVAFSYLKRARVPAGRLTLIDNPGPNEMSHSPLLRDIVHNQLERASGVLLVTAVTGIDSEAAWEVREQIASVRGQIGNRMYVLVNKIDDLQSSEKPNEFLAKVQKLLGVEEEQVFGISARRADWSTCAKTFVTDDGLDPALPWVKDFAETVFAKRRWEKDIKSRDKVLDEAEALWEDSQLEIPLDKVIANSFERAAPIALLVAITSVV